MSNPFNEGTKIYQVFDKLSDGQWHCGKHELPGTQPAKAIQIIRQNGYEVEKKTFECPVCKERTVHRKLISTQPSAPSIIRQSISNKIRQRVLAHYKNLEAITNRTDIPSERLEVDHRFPQVRWSKQEEILDPNMSEMELHQKFQLLTRENNLWKSRYCERCAKTGERGKFIGINFFAEGGLIWDTNIPSDDERGCYGCFWFDPQKWKEGLNKKLSY